MSFVQYLQNAPTKITEGINILTIPVTRLWVRPHFPGQRESPQLSFVLRGGVILQSITDIPRVHVFCFPGANGTPEHVAYERTSVNVTRMTSGWIVDVALDRGPFFRFSAFSEPIRYYVMVEFRPGEKGVLKTREVVMEVRESGFSAVDLLVMGA